MKIETADRFAVINNPHHVKVFDVYIDGSFKSGYTSDNTKNSPYGSGWALVTRETAKPKLLGYGMTQFWDTYSPSSEVGELRSILQFFRGLEENFPHMLDQRHKYYVICDNTNLVQIANKSTINTDTLRSAEEKYGEDYQQLLQFAKKTNITFEWVKGHASNKFNCFADTMAYKAYRVGHLEHELSSLERFCFITDQIVKRKLMDQQSLENLKSEIFIARKKLYARRISAGQSVEEMEAWKQGNSIHVGSTSILSENNYHQGIVISLDGGKTMISGTKTITDEGSSKIEIQLRAIQQALFAYRAAHGTDTALPLTVHTNIKAIPHIINSLRKGVFPNTSSSLTKEIENLKMLMIGMKVRSVYDGGLVVSRMASHALRLAQKSINQSQNGELPQEITDDQKVLTY